MLGAQVAFGVTPSIGYLDFDARAQIGAATVGVQDDRTSLGDLTLATNFYWDWAEWNLLWANYLVVPVGRYEVDDLANTGLNIWTFETDIAITYFNETSGRDYSVVVGYGYNTENDDTNYKTGDEVHVNFVLNQFLSASFAIGINGFYFRQLSGDSGEGARLGSFKGEASGIGPAVYWNREFFGRDVFFTFKWLRKFDVENRLEGDHVFASFAFSF